MTIPAFIRRPFLPGMACAIILAALSVPSGPAHAEDCADLPSVLGEGADKSQIRCALRAAQQKSMTRGISIVETDAAVEAVSFAINFEFASARITPASQMLLMAVAQVIAEDADLRRAAYFIDGHTDAVGSEAANMTLGLKRARATAEQLQDALGFEVTMNVRSYGETRLIQPDAPESGENRRVEITPVSLE